MGRCQFSLLHNLRDPLIVWTSPEVEHFVARYTHIGHISQLALDDPAESVLLINRADSSAGITPAGRALEVLTYRRSTKKKNAAR